RGGLALFGGALVLAATALGAGLWWEDSRQRARWAEPAAVVVSSGADLRTGTSEEYPKRLDERLPAGVEMKILGERGGWLHVELGGGAVGWVRRDRVAQVNCPGPVRVGTISNPDYNPAPEPRPFRSGVRHVRPAPGADRDSLSRLGQLCADPDRRPAEGP